MKRASVHTLGCRLNQSESQILAKNLSNRGYTLVPFNQESDLAIINTCTVTNNADSDCRNNIRSYIKRNPKSFVAVIGCYSQMGYKELSKIEGIDLIIGNQEKLNVLNYISEDKNKEPIIIRDQIIRDDFEIEIVGQETTLTRANLKVQDGCDFMCSFCIIPFARGRARSRNINNLLEEANTLVEQGFQEIVLTGVNIGTYHNENYTLLDVVDKLNEIKNLKRIRISSIEPTTIDERLFDRMQDKNHALVPYLHIPLQSASNKILQIMKRKYTIEEFASFIQNAKSKVDNLCIGSDILVGMPQETEQDFQDTYNFLQESEINYFHVFSFSERKGTKACQMPDKNNPQTIKLRSAKLRSLSFRKKRQFYYNQLDQEATILTENYKDGLWTGYSANFSRIAIQDDEQKLCKNTFYKVRYKKVSADFIEGQLV